MYWSTSALASMFLYAGSSFLATPPCFGQELFMDGQTVAIWAHGSGNVRAAASRRPWTAMAAMMMCTSCRQLCSGDEFYAEGTTSVLKSRCKACTKIWAKVSREASIQSRSADLKKFLKEATVEAKSNLLSAWKDFEKSSRRRPRPRFNFSAFF